MASDGGGARRPEWLQRRIDALSSTPKGDVLDVASDKPPVSVSAPVMGTIDSSLTTLKGVDSASSGGSTELMGRIKALKEAYASQREVLSGKLSTGAASPLQYSLDGELPAAINEEIVAPRNLLTETVTMDKDDGSLSTRVLELKARQSSLLDAGESSLLAHPSDTSLSARSDRGFMMDNVPTASPNANTSGSMRMIETLSVVSVVDSDVDGGGDGSVATILSHRGSFAFADVAARREKEASARNAAEARIKMIESRKRAKDVSTDEVLKMKLEADAAHASADARIRAMETARAERHASAVRAREEEARRRELEDEKERQKQIHLANMKAKEEERLREIEAERERQKQVQEMRVLELQAETDRQLRLKLEAKKAKEIEDERLRQIEAENYIQRQLAAAAAAAKAKEEEEARHREIEAEKLRQKQLEIERLKSKEEEDERLRQIEAENYRQTQLASAAAAAKAKEEEEARYREIEAEKLHQKQLEIERLKAKEEEDERLRRIEESHHQHCIDTTERNLLIPSDSFLKYLSDAQTGALDLDNKNESDPGSVWELMEIAASIIQQEWRMAKVRKQQQVVAEVPDIQENNANDADDILQLETELQDVAALIIQNVWRAWRRRREAPTRDVIADDDDNDVRRALESFSTVLNDVAGDIEPVADVPSPPSTHPSNADDVLEFLDSLATKAVSPVPDIAASGAALEALDHSPRDRIGHDENIPKEVKEILFYLKGKGIDPNTTTTVNLIMEILQVSKRKVQVIGGVLEGAADLETRMCEDWDGVNPNHPLPLGEHQLDWRVGGPVAWNEDEVGSGVNDVTLSQVLTPVHMHHCDLDNTSPSTPLTLGLLLKKLHREHAWASRLGGYWSPPAPRPVVVPPPPLLPTTAAMTFEDGLSLLEHQRSLDYELEGAVIDGDLVAVMGLLDAGADPMGWNSRKGIHLGGGDSIAVNESNGRQSVTLHPADTAGITLRKTPLHWACECGHAEIASVLLDSGADIMAKSRQLLTPLHVAAVSGRDSCVSLVILYASAMDERTEGRESVKQLLLDSRTRTGWTALHMAVLRGHASTVRLLLDAGMDVDAADGRGYTALMVGCAGGPDRSDVVAALLETACASISTCDVEGRTPLHLACESKAEESVEMLLAVGACVTVAAKDGATPLHIATRLLCVAIVELLLVASSASALVRQGDTSDWTVDNGDIVLDACIIETGETPLMLAITALKSIKTSAPSTEVIEILIESGCSVNHKKKGSGWTALHLAATVSPIVKSRDDDDDQNANLNRPEMQSSITSSLGSTISKLLLHGGANPYSIDCDGRTSLHVAITSGDVATVYVLLDAGADASARTSHGKSCLDLSVAADLESISKLLLLFGARINDASDSDGCTALHQAVIAWSWSQVKICLQGSADPLIMDKHGWLPVHYHPLYDRLRKQLDSEDLDRLTQRVVTLNQHEKDPISPQDEEERMLGLLPPVSQTDSERPLPVSTLRWLLRVQLLYRRTQRWSQYSDAFILGVRTENIKQLHAAASDGDVDTVNTMLSSSIVGDIDPFLPHPSLRESALHAAVIAGSIECIRVFLSCIVDKAENIRSKLVNTRNSDRMTPLHLACVLSPRALDDGLCQSSDYPTSKIYLRKKEEAEIRCEIVRILLAAGGDISMKDAFGRVPLDYALGSASEEIVNSMTKGTTAAMWTPGQLIVAVDVNDLLATALARRHVFASSRSSQATLEVIEDGPGQHEDSGTAIVTLDNSNVSQDRQVMQSMSTHENQPLDASVISSFPPKVSPPLISSDINRLRCRRFKRLNQALEGPMKYSEYCVKEPTAANDGKLFLCKSEVLSRGDSNVSLPHVQYAMRLATTLRGSKPEGASNDAASHISESTCVFCGEKRRSVLSECSLCHQALFCSSQCRRQGWIAHRPLCTHYIRKHMI